MNSFTGRVYLVALLLRLIPVLLSSNLGIGLDDMFQYDMLGRSLAAGKGYRWYAQEDLQLILPYIDIDLESVDYDPQGIPTSFRAPLYPAFLSSIYTLFGLEQRFFFSRMAQAFLTTLLAPLTYALGRRVFPQDERVAKLAALILAVYPLLIVFPLALATENLFFVLVLAALVALLRAGDTHRWRDYGLAALLLGLAALTRSVILAFLPLAILWAWVYAKDRLGALILPLGVLALTLPWAARNTMLHERLTFVESSMGYNLYLGYHPEGSGTFQFGISLDLLPILDDAKRDRAGTQAAMDFIREDPGRLPALMAMKLGHFFALERRALSYFYTNNLIGFLPTALLGTVFLVFVLPFIMVISLAALALPFLERNKELRLLLLLMLGYLLPHVFIMAEERFHLTLVPVFAVIAAYAWVYRREILTKARSPHYRLAVVTAMLLLGLLFANWGWELARDFEKLLVLFGPEGNTAGFSY